MIKAENLSYEFPQKELYNDISFTIERGEHCAFIGVSGSGKSTLIQLLLHPDDYMYEGGLTVEHPCHIGYMRQFSDVPIGDTRTVFDYIAEPFVALQTQIDALCEEMASSDDLDAVFVRYQDALDAYEAIGGDAYESMILKKLHVADMADYGTMQVSTLSGGEFKLIQVIKEMLVTPDLLIMDEPDVFLDFENLNALRSLINTHKGTLLVITHNRYLLTHCFNKILHLENKKLHAFEGTYLDYNFSLLEDKIERQEQSVADTLEIDRNEALIERLREEATYIDNPSKGKALKARVKIQERLRARRMMAPFLAIKEPGITFPVEETLAPDATALEVTDFGVTFDEVLLQDVSFTIGANEKVALIGPNGTGKTTLLRALFTGEDSRITWHEGIQVGYLSQQQGETLDESLCVVDMFLGDILETREDVAAYLASYSLEEELLRQPIAALSGGEKNMLQLAKLGLTPNNFLLLDEPTSHLDTYSQVALEKALNTYEGGVVMISHDFYTLVNCMDYALLIDDKTIRKVSMRKLRKTVYAKHFDKDYLEREQKKKALELQIERALKKSNFTEAHKACETLETLLKSFK